MVALKNGKILKYQIPIDNFPKPEKNREPLPYWHFSKKDYTAELVLNSEVEEVEIDPSMRLMDINILNNHSGFIPRQEFHFMRYASEVPPLNRYVWEFWPTAFYNDRDKAKLGFNLKGSYLDIDHKLDLWLWYKTGIGNVDFDFSYNSPVSWFGKMTNIYVNTYTLDGRQGGEISISHVLNESRRAVPKYKIDVGITNHKLFDEKYLMTPWSFGNVNSLFFNWAMESSYYSGLKPRHLLQINMISSTLGSSFNFSQVSLEWFRKIWNSYSNWELDLRFFTGYSEGNVPEQYLYNLSGDNSWGEFQQSFYRSQGSLPYPWRRNGHLYKQGGGNIRGYSLVEDYLTLFAPKIAAFNIDILLPNPLETLYLPVIEDIEPAFFMDFGTVWNNKMPDFKLFRKSAGIAIAWNAFYYLDYWFNLNQVRIDFPLWLSDVKNGEKNVDFRWQIRFDFNY